MVRRKIFKFIMEAITAGLIALSLLTVSFNAMPSHYTKAFNSTKIEYKVEYKETIGKVLVYNSHSCEDYQGENISKGTADLCEKLKKRGIEVTFLNEKFAETQGYNKSYSSSRNALKEINLSEYDLIIDYHRDYSPNRSTITTKYNTQTASIKAVLTKECNEYDYKENLVNKLKNNANNFFGENVWGDTFYYNKGINFYNQDLSKNSILLEVGNDKSSMWDIKAANTIIAKSIQCYLS